MLSILLLPLLAIIALGSPLESRAPKYNVTAMDQALKRGSGILGTYSKCSGSLCSWMSNVPDNTRLTDMSIPGTHDSASWNYTPLKQIEYLKYTNLIYPSPLYKCGSTSLFKQLAAGNRAFDLRVGFAPNGKDLIFFHSEAILDIGARFEDVMYGFYRFLEENPGESLVVSVKDENATWGTTQALQQSLYTTLTSQAALPYVNPSTSISSSTLKSVRGKITILRRFSLDQVPSAQGLGVDLTNGWADNNPSFSLPTPGGDKVFIEDLYEPNASKKGLTPNVNLKLNVTIANIVSSSERSQDDGLYLTFASSEQAYQLLVPQIMAQGLIVPGVNQGLKSWLIGEGKGKGLKKKGVIFTDFASETPGLVEAIIA